MIKVVIDENGVEHNVQMSKDEINEINERHKEFMSRKIELDAQQVEKQTKRQGLLEKLGITEEEAKLLLG